MSDTIYCYPPDHIVLRNKLDLRNGHAGHRIDLRRIGKDDWIAASKAAFQGHNEPFATCIAKALDITS